MSAERQGQVGGRQMVSTARQEMQGLVGLGEAREELSGLEGQGALATIGARAAGQVLAQMALVVLGRTPRVASALEGFARAQGVTGARIQLAGARELARLSEDARGIERVAALQQAFRVLDQRRDARRGRGGGRAAARHVERLVATSEARQHVGRRAVLTARQIGLRGLLEQAVVFEQAAGSETLAFVEQALRLQLDGRARVAQAEQTSQVQRVALRSDQLSISMRGGLT